MAKLIIVGFVGYLTYIEKITELNGLLGLPHKFTFILLSTLCFEVSLFVIINLKIYSHCL